jgi:hypothetical protein
MSKRYAKSLEHFLGGRQDCVPADSLIIPTSFPLLPIVDTCIHFSDPHFTAVQNLDFTFLMISELEMITILYCAAAARAGGEVGARHEVFLIN